MSNEVYSRADAVIWVLIAAVFVGLLFGLILNETTPRDAQIEDLTHRLSEAESLADRAVTDLTGPFEASAWMFRCIVTPDPER